MESGYNFPLSCLQVEEKDSEWGGITETDGWNNNHDEDDDDHKDKDNDDDNKTTF